MSKYHKIKWRESDLEEINRVVKNFNAKIKRLSKKNPGITSSLPELVKTSELRNIINTRQDLKRELNALKRFSKRGSERIVTVEGNDYNLTLTKWQKTEMNRRIGIINRKRKARLERLKEVELKHNGESLGYTLGQLGMGKATEVSLSPMNAFTRTMNRADLKMKWKSIFKESQSDYFTKKDFQVKENYIKGLLQTYNERDIEDVVTKIRNMDIDEFLHIFESDGGTFEFASDLPSNDLMEGYVTHLKSTWLPRR